MASKTLLQLIDHESSQSINLIQSAVSVFDRYSDVLGIPIF